MNYFTRSTVTTFIYFTFRTFIALKPLIILYFPLYILVCHVCSSLRPFMVYIREHSKNIYGYGDVTSIEHKDVSLL